MKMQEYPSETDARISATVRALASGGNVDMMIVARALALPKATVYNKLRGDSPWKASEVAALAHFFKVRIPDFYDGLNGRFGPPVDAAAALRDDKGTVHCLKPYLTGLTGGGLNTAPVRPPLKLVSDAA